MNDFVNAPAPEAGTHETVPVIFTAGERGWRTAMFGVDLGETSPRTVVAVTQAGPAGVDYRPVAAWDYDEATDSPTALAARMQELLGRRVTVITLPPTAVDRWSGGAAGRPLAGVVQAAREVLECREWGYPVGAADSLGREW